MHNCMEDQHLIDLSGTYDMFTYAPGLLEHMCFVTRYNDYSVSIFFPDLAFYNCVSTVFDTYIPLILFVF